MITKPKSLWCWTMVNINIILLSFQPSIPHGGIKAHSKFHWSKRPTSHETITRREATRTSVFHRAPRELVKTTLIQHMPIDQTNHRRRLLLSLNSNFKFKSQASKQYWILKKSRQATHQATRRSSLANAASKFKFELGTPYSREASKLLYLR